MGRFAGFAIELSPVSLNNGHFKFMSLDMIDSIAALLAPGKGILAADESFPTIGKRFQALDMQSTEANREAYREMLFTTPGLNEFLSGAIMFDETIRQRSTGGVPLPELLMKRGILPGIKVDEGTVPLPNFPDEKFTHGLDDLRQSLSEYYELGARFTKWRAVIRIDQGLPTEVCIEANAHALALFAALSQEASLVPIVEPEVLIDGDHTLARCEEVTRATLECVFDELFAHRVVLEETLLKTGMVLSGKDCPQQAEVAEVSETTIRCPRRTVPSAVPGVVFLSGGQEEVEATQRLNAICAVRDLPWTASFSFGRALQDAALKMWRGSAANVASAQATLYHRAKCNGFAVQGKYSGVVEGESSAN